MQHLSLGVAAGGLAGPFAGSHLHEFLARPEIRRLAWVLLGLIFIGQIVTIAAHWTASKALAEREFATLSKAAKLWLFHWLYIVGCGVGLTSLTPWVFSLENRWQSIAILSGVSLLVLTGFFLIPMKIYIITFWRALGMLVLSWIMQAAAMGGVQYASQAIFFTPRQISAMKAIGGPTAEERQRFRERLAGKDAPDEIDRMLDDILDPIGPQKPLPEREAATVAIKHKLEERQRTLPPGNPPAAAAFQRQLDRYLRLLSEVKSERSPPPATQAH